MDAELIIAGGGPGGALLAALCARRGVGTLLLEAAPAPRHRLCGEFLSGEAADILREAGLAALWEGAGGAPLDGVVLHAPDGPVRASLPRPARGLSRAILDPALREAARAAGARVVAGERVVGASGGPGGWQVRVEGGGRAGERRATLLVAADGRRGSLAAPLPATPGDPCALKFHAAPGEPPDAANHLHFFPGGYVGVNAVEDGALNVCFLLRREETAAAAADPLAWLRARLGARFLPGAREIPGTRCATGPVRFGRWRDYPPGLFSVGDAAVAIDPFCGDGMAMALAGAHAAAPLLLAARDRSAAEHPECAGALRAALRREFAPRLALAGALRAAARRPALARPLLAWIAADPARLAWLARRTRGE